MSEEIAMSAYKKSKENGSSIANLANQPIIEATANRVISVTDLYKRLHFNSTSNLTCTIPPDADLTAEVGASFTVMRMNTGTVTFVGEWPSGVARTHIVLFKNLIQTEADFFPPNLSYVSNEIDSGTVLLEYDSRENNLLDVKIAPGTYKYIVVAQSTKEALSLQRKDWFVVGVYYTGNDKTKPGSIIVNEGRVTEGVDIICDFDNPPPQPPGG